MKEILPEVNQVKRETVSASHITVGLQCGGSDGFSSITANPALGAAVDILARHGGTAILSETPEIYGVEHTLTRRAASRAVGEKLVERIRWWKEEYSVGRDVQINGKVLQTAVILRRTFQGYSSRYWTSDWRTKRPLALIFDWMQYLNKKELGALIMAMHKVAQKQLPVALFGAGLPPLVRPHGEFEILR